MTHTTLLLEPPAPAPREAAAARHRTWRLLGRYTLLSVLAFVVLFPIYITVVNSLLPSAQIAAQPPKPTPRRRP